MTTYLCPMRLVYCALITLVFFVSCESARKDNSTKIALAARKIDSLSVLKRPCSCTDTVRTWYYNPEINFGNYSSGSGYGAMRNFERIPTDDEMLAKFGSDSARLAIKSISFTNQDTIAEKFKIFENVESVQTTTTHGLDLFPKLKNVSFFSADVHIDSTMKWPRRIETVSFEKCRVSGLTSFKSFHNLTYLNATYSFFDAPIKDIESLSCLQVLVFGAHMKGDIDLEQVDISEFTCLRRMVWHSWVKGVNVQGIPKGLNDHSKRVELEVAHPNLTDAEKANLKNYSKFAEAKLKE